jgi:type IV pilus assembly protein PilA
MKRFMKRTHRGEKGFTLIELLIVIAILGIIAAIVVPNVAGFLTSGRLNAAQTEAENVKTAAVGYLAEEGVWPQNSDSLDAFLEGTHTALKAQYVFGGDAGIESVSDQEWENIHWDADSQVWVRGEATGPILPGPILPGPIHPGPVPIR